MRLNIACATKIISQWVQACACLSLLLTSGCTVKWNPYPLTGKGNSSSGDSIVSVPTPAPPAGLAADLRSLFNTVFGQPSFSVNQGQLLGLYNPGKVLYSGGKLFLIDTYHQRLLIWNSPPLSNSTAPDVVLGQKTPYLNEMPPIANASSMNSPVGVCSNGVKLAVADTNNHRVLIWNTVPTVTGTPADVVLGQTDFTGLSNNQGGTPSASTLYQPRGIFCSGTRLWVADASNNRILFWNSIPTVNGTPADGVLGQPDFTSNLANNGGISASTVFSAKDVAEVNGHVVVADTFNHRLLIWNTLLPASSVAADAVLGQANFASGNSNPGGLSGHSFSSPTAVDAVGTSLYVGDSGNHRILAWTSFPVAWNTNANFVLGQPDAISAIPNNGGRGAQSLYSPAGASSDGTRLFVSDTFNERLLIFDTLPTSTPTSANRVWGQSSLTVAAYGNGANPSVSLNQPYSISLDNNHVWVADSLNCRYLRFPAAHTPFDGSVPDLVLFQPTLSNTDCGLGTNSIGANNPGNGSNAATRLVSNGVKTYALDSGNHRVLIWTSYPGASGVAPDAVLGQLSSLSTGTPNNGGLSDHSLNIPLSMAMTNTQLLVADSSNNRILIWNSLPTADVSANVVLGQPDMTHSAPNSGGISASTLSNPTCVVVYNSMLFVCDTGNHRILVWNTIPNATVPADRVIGQADFLSGSANAGQGTTNAIGLKSPYGVAYNGSKLFVSDNGNHRILVWNTLPAGPGLSANSVIGQFDFVSAIPNSGGLSGRTLYSPTEILLNGLDLWVSDFANNRILELKNAE